MENINDKKSSNGLRLNCVADKMQYKFKTKDYEQ